MLILLVEGPVSDIPQMAAALKEANNLPLSVVFVGLGETSFPSLLHLHSLLKELRRNFVQLLPVRDLLDAFHEDQKEQAPAIAKQVNCLLRMFK